MPAPFISALIPAELDWIDEQPFSRQFNDVYYSRADGIDESRYVFLQQNQLEQRWQTLHDDFVIAETGFGTGLNFLAATELWLKTNQLNTLHFISVDKHPLRQSDFIKSSALWPELTLYAQTLAENYPALMPGWHRVRLFEGRVLLSLYFGDIDKFMHDSNFKADAWFLDGFAPDKNQAMWSDTVYQHLFRLSHPGATLATYTAAGRVRRGLQAAGFNINKQKGYGNKRELLTGKYDDDYNEGDTAKPWFAHQCINNHQKSITIIGAGLAGAFTANTFAEQGYQVTVIESESKPAQKASGNHQAMLYGRFSAYPSLQYDFYHQAYLHSLTRLKNHEHFIQSGLLEISFDDKSEKKLTQLKAAAIWPDELMRFVDDEQASILTGLPINKEGMYLPQSGYVKPRHLCEALLKHRNIKLTNNCYIDKLNYEKDHWQLLDQNNKILHESALVVITTAANCLQFEQCQYLPLKNIRGQVSYLKANNKSKRLQMPICYEGYIAPAQDGVHTIGASFNLDSNNEERCQEDDLDNLRRLKQHLPKAYNEIELNKMSIENARVGFRCHTTDYLPVIGPVPDKNFFEKNYHGLRHGQLKKNYKQGKFIPGLFLNVAHGSKGVISTPLAAELLYAYVHHKGAFPVGERVRQALHPARFLIKSIRKN